jgi:hypothetical protein
MGRVAHVPKKRVLCTKKTYGYHLLNILKKIKNNINRMIDNSTKYSLIREIQVSF